MKRFYLLLIIFIIGSSTFVFAEETIELDVNLIDDKQYSVNEYNQESSFDFRFINPMDYLNSTNHLIFEINNIPSGNYSFYSNLNESIYEIVFIGKKSETIKQKQNKFIINYFNLNEIESSVALDEEVEIIDSIKIETNLVEEFDFSRYTKEIHIDEQDFFHKFVYNTNIDLKYNDYLLVLKFKEGISIKDEDYFGIREYKPHISAMTKEDLHVWSKSYTDESLVQVENNGATYVNMAKYAPEIISWSQISTTQNRTYQPLDYEDIIIQRKDFADILIKANENLMEHGYRILLYDGYRSKFATSELYNYTINDLKKPLEEREYKEMTFENKGWYVVNPNSPYDRHGKGTATDLSIVNMSTGKMVNLPTRANFMGRAGWIDETLSNSEEYKLLHSALVSAGARPYKREWYHWSHVAKNEIGYPDKGLRSLFYKKEVKND